MAKSKVLEVFAEVKIQVLVFRVVTPCSVVVGYHRFRNPCCVHLHDVFHVQKCNFYLYSVRFYVLFLQISEFLFLIKDIPDWPLGARTANGTPLCN
jgi:hypothetical protein